MFSASSLLFVPGSRPDRFEKARASGAGLVVIDLEDAVATSIKDQARDNAREALGTIDYGSRLRALRVNGADTPWHAADLRLVAEVCPDAVLLPKTDDADALLAIADADPAAADGPIGAVGFCMSGGLAMSVARAHPERVKAVASIHGAWLVRDGDDSPHLGLDAIDAELHFGWADNDATAPVEDMAVLEAALVEAGVAVGEAPGIVRRARRR